MIIYKIVTPSDNYCLIKATTFYKTVNNQEMKYHITGGESSKHCDFKFLLYYFFICN